MLTLFTKKSTSNSRKLHPKIEQINYAISSVFCLILAVFCTKYPQWHEIRNKLKFIGFSYSAKIYLYQPVFKKWIFRKICKKYMYLIPLFQLTP